jgi:hypothetical protein
MDNPLLTTWFRDVSVATSSTRIKGTWSVMILICWNIWRERNARIFEGTEKPPDRLISEIKDEARL